MNDFNDFSITDIYLAYYDCRKNKRNTKNALEFEINLEENLLNLYNDLISNKYNIWTSICFIIVFPKPREIFAANFRDRIVHHLVYNKIEKLFSKWFVYDSSASQKWKGVLFSQRRTYKHMQSITQNFKLRWYYLQMDIKNFFPSIDKNILEKLLLKKIPKWFFRDLTIQILRHSPINDFDFRWNKYLYTKIKKYKSLFFTPKDKWLAIWNLTSQLFANIYLNELDNYIKRDLKCKYYQRYVDDFVILSLDNDELKILREKIKRFTIKYLDIEVHPNKIIMQRIDQWINYIWAVIKPYCIYTRNRTYWNFENILNKYKNKVLNKQFIDKERFLSQLNSYMWFIKHSNYKKRFLMIYNKYKFYLDKYFNLNIVRMCFVLRDW